MNISNWEKLPLKVVDVLRKNRIISFERGEDGQLAKKETYTQVNLRKARDAEGKALGEGPIISQETLRRLIETDTSKDTAWLGWMFFQSGGGAEAERRSVQALEQVRDRFIEERVRGYRDMCGQFHNPISKEEAESKWVVAAPKFSDVLIVGDQDMVEKLQVFGFYRNWPGLHKGYERVETAVKRFLELYPKTVEMNAFMQSNSMPDKVVALKPEDYATIEVLDQAIKKVERFFASKEARLDIRIEPIYEDEVLTMFCPLTYAAAVRYGWDVWPFANRNTFESNLETTNAWNDAWKNMTGKESKTVVYIHFKVPVPSWISLASNKFLRFSLQNLAVMIPNALFKEGGDPKSVTLLNEEGMTIPISSVREMIVAEVTRDDDPAAEEYPVSRGPRVYADVKEAGDVMDSLDRGLVVMQKWMTKFKPSKVVSDYLPKSVTES